MKNPIQALTSHKDLLGSGVALLTIIVLLSGLYTSFLSHPEIELHHRQSWTEKKKGEIVATNNSGKFEPKALIEFEENVKRVEVWKSGCNVKTVYDTAVVVLDTLLSRSSVVVKFEMYKEYKSADFDALFTGLNINGTKVKEQETRRKNERDILILLVIIFGYCQFRFTRKLYRQRRKIFKRIENAVIKNRKMIGNNGTQELAKITEYLENLLEEFDEE